LVPAWRERGAGLRRWVVSLAGRSLPLLALLVVGAVPALVVSTLNFRHYGVFLTTLRRSPALIALEQRLGSLEPDGRRPYVTVSRPARLKAYALSPAFARLAPFIEEGSGFWRAGNPAHAAANGLDAEQRDLTPSMADLALCDAAAHAGAVTAPAMEALFATIASELEQAVRTGRIAAGTQGYALLLPPRPGDGGRIVRAWWTSFASLLGVEHVPYYWPDAVVGTPAQLDDLARLTHSSVGLIPKPTRQYSARAWVFEHVKAAQRVLSPLLLFAWFLLVVLWRRKTTSAQSSPSGLLVGVAAIPLAGLVAFCFGMALVEVLAFRFLRSGSYNQVGFGPLSVFAACVFAALTAALPPEFWRRPVRMPAWLRRGSEDRSELG
jgi:hypothetical protein